MNLSSILVFTSPDEIESIRSSLCELPGIEVHYQCHETGRLVVVQEAPDEELEMEGLRKIKSLPGVLAAEMYYHHVDGDDSQASCEPVAQGNDGGVFSWA
jgi:nitrate reductase NapAB chaperone NapD